MWTLIPTATAFVFVVTDVPYVPAVRDHATRKHKRQDVCAKLFAIKTRLPVTTGSDVADPRVTCVGAARTIETCEDA
jgi:hypothetical protein